MKASIELKLSFDAEAASAAMKEYMEKSAGRAIDAPSLAEYIRVGVAAGCKIEEAPDDDPDGEIHADDAIAQHAHRADDGERMPFSRPIHDDSVEPIAHVQWEQSKGERQAVFSDDRSHMSVDTQQRWTPEQVHNYAIAVAHILNERIDARKAMKPDATSTSHDFNRSVRDALHEMCPGDDVEIEGRAWRDTTVDFVLQGNDYAAFVEGWRVFARGWQFDDGFPFAVLAARAWKARGEMANIQIEMAEQCTRMEEREKKAATLKDYYEMTHALMPLHVVYKSLPMWQRLETVPMADGRVVDLDRCIRANIHKTRGPGLMQKNERIALRSLFVDWLRMVDDCESPAVGEPQGVTK